MARLVGVDLPRDKRMAVALTYIYGVGRSQAAKALEATGISPDLRSKCICLFAHLPIIFNLQNSIA